MTTMRFVRAASPYAAATVTAVLAAMVVTTLSLCRFDRDATMFLCGILAMGIFALVSRSANLRWTIARRTRQLKAARDKLAAEHKLRSHAEETLARQIHNVEFLDREIPSMIAYVDREGVVRYHNRAYARWVGLPDASIDGRHAREIVGASAYAELEPRLRAALRGTEVRYERTQTMSDSERFRLFVQYVPHLGGDGAVAGVFAILTDITAARDMAPLPRRDEEPAVDAATRLLAALERDEFCLYVRPIRALGGARQPDAFHEVLVRLREEEENHLPAGMFLRAAEEHGLMPQLDRWVVRKVLAAAADPAQTHFLNIAPETAADPAFAGFVEAELAAHDRPGSRLCLQFTERELVANPRAYRALAEALAPRGCRFAVSGFSCNPQAVQFLAQLGIHFVKIDGCIVLNVMRCPADLARVKEINQRAHAAGIRTIAECVEDETTRVTLARTGTDFAQGFGIEEPRRMEAAPEVEPLEAAA